MKEWHLFAIVIFVVLRGCAVMVLHIGTNRKQSSKERIAC